MKLKFFNCSGRSLRFFMESFTRVFLVLRMEKTYSWRIQDWMVTQPHSHSHRHSRKTVLRRGCLEQGVQRQKRLTPLERMCSADCLGVRWLPTSPVHLHRRLQSGKITFCQCQCRVHCCSNSVAFSDFTVCPWRLYPKRLHKGTSA